MSELTANERIGANLISRLDKMPINKKLIAIVLLVAWCWVMEAFDLGIIGQSVLVLRSLWNLDASQIGLLGVCSTVGIVIGLSLSGSLTDKHGRKKVLLVGVFIFTFFTLVGSAVANFYYVVLMRFIAGLGAGSIFPLPYVMISEVAPSKKRALLVGLCSTILALSYSFPTIVGSWAIANFEPELAWRVPFFVGGSGVVTVVFLWMWLPESPRWLIRNGHLEEAKDLVEKLEKSAGVPHDENYIDEDVVAQLKQAKINAEAASSSCWTAVFKPPYLAGSIASWLMLGIGLTAWYVLMTYVPTILHDAYGIDRSVALLYGGALAIVNGFGVLCMGPFSDKYGRKPVLTFYAGITIVTLIYLVTVDDISWMIFYSCFVIIAFFGAGNMPVAKLYIAEQYPTALRGKGAGFGEAAARILGGVLSTYIIAFFLNVGGTASIFMYMLVLYIIAVILLWIFGKETAFHTVA